MRSPFRSAVLACLLSLPVVGIFLAPGCGHDATEPGHEVDTRVYECSMGCVKPGESHPYTHVGPGDCPVCGMHLVVSSVQPATAPTKN